VSLSGVGLHLGEPCTLTFRPASAGTGIAFRRTDLDGAPVIPAHVSQVTASERRTQIGHGESAIHTVEHVLSAVAAVPLDDVWIEMDGPEPPIMDGSAAPFYDALLRAGVVEGAGEPEYLTLTEPVRIIDGASVYEAYPADSLSLDVTIDFPHPTVGRQQGTYTVTPAAYRAELADARTFGFLHEVDALRAKGLIKGASTQNAVVMDAKGVVDTTLRWPDEFVRHKAMDCVGDLALAGKRVRARIIAVKPSHRGTVTLVREMVRVAANGVVNSTANGTTGASVNAAAGSIANETHQGGQAPRQTNSERSVMAGMSIEEIMKVLPHRYPFLLVDRILEIESGKRIVGIKNVTINEPFFIGHFPGHPIMPGVLVIEAMAQVGGMLLMGTVENPENKVVYFIGLDNVRWRRPVKPGDQIRFELEVVQIRGTVCKMRGVAKVDGELAAEADMAAMVRDR
jgi:UDP-3-O-[3-hydroxymyristoyl] N-acetylglucosamine deacetylase/3-hydroxyacyl-[acyl-carrier-protein] dehydratase